MSLRFVPTYEDICAGKHGGEPFSEAANPSMTKKARDSARIYAFVHSLGEHGATANEAERALGICHSTASARFSDMKERRELLPNGKRRKTEHGHDAGVYVTRGTVEARKPAQGFLL